MKKVRLTIIETSNKEHHLRSIEGNLIKNPTVGERFHIDSSIQNSTSPVEEIISVIGTNGSFCTTFRTNNTTWKLEEI